MAITRLGLTATPTKPYGSFAGKSDATAPTGGDVQEFDGDLATLITHSAAMELVCEAEGNLGTLVDRSADVVLGYEADAELGTLIERSAEA